MIDTLAVDGWAVTFDTAKAMRGLGGAAAPPSPVFALPNVTAHPLTAIHVVYQLHIVQCGTIITFGL